MIKMLQGLGLISLSSIIFVALPLTLFGASVSLHMLPLPRFGAWFILEHSAGFSKSITPFSKDVLTILNRKRFFPSELPSLPLYGIIYISIEHFHGWLFALPPGSLKAGSGLFVSVSVPSMCRCAVNLCQIELTPCIGPGQHMGLNLSPKSYCEKFCFI